MGRVVYKTSKTRPKPYPWPAIVAPIRSASSPTCSGQVRPGAPRPDPKPDPLHGVDKSNILPIQ